MADIVWLDTTNGSAKTALPVNTVDAFVCSQTYAGKNGGVSAVAEIARGVKAAVLIIGRGESNNFSIRTEMKGNLIHLNMAASDCLDPHLSPDFPSNYSLQMACSLLLDDDYVAVADTKSLELMALSRRVSQTDVTVFINGPTGTGKEVLARFIHNQSSRRAEPVVAVNCAAIPENMLEAILFGHEKGALLAPQRPIKEFSVQLTGAPFFWMKSLRCPLVFRLNCCGFCRKRRSRHWAASES